MPLPVLGYGGCANVKFERDPRDDMHQLIEVNARRPFRPKPGFWWPGSGPQLPNKPGGHQADNQVTGCAQR